MGNKRVYIGSAGVIAVAIFIYLGFFAANPTGEDVSGTISSVQKYQTDQISDTDVVLAGEENIIDEMAQLVDHATVEEKSEMLSKASPEMTSGILAHCDNSIMAQIWGKMDQADKVAAFNAQAKDNPSLLGRSDMTMATFNKLTVEKKAEALERASMQEKADMAKSASIKAQMTALARMDMQGRAAVMQEFNTREKAMIAGKTAVPTRQAILARMDLQGRVNLVRNASEFSRAYMFNQAQVVDQEALLNSATMEEKASLFARLELKEQISGTLARAEYSKDPNLIGRATGAVVEDMYAQTPANLRKEMFGRLDQAKQEAIAGRVAMKAEAMGKMSMEEVSGFLQQASTKDKQEMLAKANYEETLGVMGKMSPASWNIYISGMKALEKAEAFGRVDMNIQLGTLKRVPDIQAAMVLRASDLVVNNVLSRAFLDSPAVK